MINENKRKLEAREDVEQECPKVIGPLFDDLIDTTIQAFKDGHIKKIRLEDDVLDVSFNINGEGLSGFLTSKTEENSHHFHQYIRDINSLYEETFVIESKEDIKKLKEGAKVVLSNGEEVIFRYEDELNGRLWFGFRDYIDNTIPYIAIKGATVTQRVAQ